MFTIVISKQTLYKCLVEAENLISAEEIASNNIKNGAASTDNCFTKVIGEDEIDICEAYVET